MVSVARKNLFQEKTRLFISVGGVAFAVTLILILQGLYQGWNSRITAYMESIDADFWVSQKGSADLSHSVSLVPKDLESAIKATDGVKAVNQFIGRQIAFKIDDEEANFFLVGFDTDENVGGPVKMAKGKSVPDDGEIIVDTVFAKNKKVKIGDRLTLNNRGFEIIGLSEGGNMVVYQYAFVKKEEAEKVFGMDGEGGKIALTNYFLVKAEPGKVFQAKESLEKNLTENTVKTREDFLDENKKLIRESFLPIIMILNLVAFFIGVALIGLTIYTATVEKAQEFGVLKAIGASNWKLFKIIFEQGFISAVIGYFIGVGLTFALLKVITNIVPAFTTEIRLVDLAFVLLAAVLMSIFAAYIPIRKVMRIDPARVFRA